MTLDEYAKRYPMTKADFEEEAAAASERAAAIEQTLRQKELEERKLLEQEEDKALIDNSSREQRSAAFKLTQEVYEGMSRGDNAAKLLLKAIEALTLYNGRPQDYDRLKENFENVYAVGLHLSAGRAAELAEIEDRLNILNESIEDLEQRPTPANKAALRDIKKAIKINKLRQQQIMRENAPTQIDIGMMDGAGNPFLKE